MALTLQEYAERLEGRPDLIWPKAPKLEPVKATPYVKPLPRVRAVLWDGYGTLVRISDGQLLLLHPQQIRMQVALEKTIKEFNMWNSMSRKPGAPWEYMFQQYRRLVEDAEMAGSQRSGDFPQVNAARIWRKLIDRLCENEYTYDESFYGDLDELSVKVAYFFHASLQGVEAMPEGLSTLMRVAGSDIRQGLLCDAQPFTLIQVLRTLRHQGRLPPLSDLFDTNCLTFSYQEGVRQPSKSLYAAALKRCDDLGIAPREVLRVGVRLREDLGVAKQLGMKTVLFAGDKTSLHATPEDVRDVTLKPDRLITQLSQICQILDIP